MAESSAEEQENPKVEQVPLAPACLVVVIFMGVIGSVLCALGSYLINRNEPEIAARAIREQLIPWVEQSALEQADKSIVAEKLTEIAKRTEDREFDEGELRRLRFCLTDNPVLLWGFVQDAMKKINSSNFTDLEKQQAALVTDRLLRMASEGKLSRTKLEMVLQKVTLGRSDGSGLERKPEATEDDLREFVKRAERIVDGEKISSEPFEKSAGQVFLIMVENSLLPIPENGPTPPKASPGAPPAAVEPPAKTSDNSTPSPPAS